MPQATTWTQLTLEQQQTVAELLGGTREALGMSARWLTLAGRIVTNFNAHVAPLLAGLSDTEVIPLSNPSAGQQALTVGEVRAAVALMAQAVATYDTEGQRAVYVKAAGVYNTIQLGR